MLSGLAVWLLGEAAGPWLVERGLDRLQRDSTWAETLVNDVAREQKLTRKQGKELRAWLTQEQVFDGLMRGDRPALEAATARLAEKQGFTDELVPKLLDQIIVQFLPSADPAFATAVADYRRARDGRQALDAQDRISEQIDKLSTTLGDLRALQHGNSKALDSIAEWARSIRDHRTVARSAYLETLVEPIAPESLENRDPELTELARFCLANQPEAPAYTWWRARAWAGKSALMATFALHPPPGVDLVAFFITARYGAYDNRAAFTEILQEQLDTLLARSTLTRSAALMESHLLRDLREAAQRSKNAGRRLVLLVDGLDEDAGHAPGLHSIAALLPAKPFPGLRVIVSSRAHPGIPRDVPIRHPLRDPDIIRTLDVAPAAIAAKHLQEAELGQLLKRGGLGRDLLGLITAARGGLTLTDLEELHAISMSPGISHPVIPHDIEEVLNTVTGRSFRTRQTRWTPGQTAYLLGHEELAQTAMSSYGTQLGAYQDLIHEWAGRYRSKDWPSGTPEYLLRGYFRMLQ